MTFDLFCTLNTHKRGKIVTVNATSERSGITIKNILVPDGVEYTQENDIQHTFMVIPNKNNKLTVLLIR